MPNVKDGDVVDEEFQKFWTIAEERAIEKFSSEENLDKERLQRLLENYTYSGRTPRSEDYASALVEKPPIRERSTILERIADKFNRFIEVFIDDV